MAAWLRSPPVWAALRATHNVLGGAEGGVEEALRAANDLLCGASITPMNRNLPEASINYPACTRSLMSV
jgi:hypothetical protein